MRKALADLAKEISGVTLLVGHPHLAGNKLYNAASVIRDGKIIATYLKNQLPNDSVFDERRYFEPGSDPCVFELEGIKFGVNICQDIWQEDTATRAKERGSRCAAGAECFPLSHAQASLAPSDCTSAHQRNGNAHRLCQSGRRTG